MRFLRVAAILALVGIPLAHWPGGFWPFDVPKEALLWLSGALVLAGLGMVAKLRLSGPARPAFVLVGAAWLWLGAATLTSSDPSGSFWGVDHRFDGLVGLWSQGLLWLAFLALLASGGRDLLLWAASFAGVAVAGWAIVERLAGVYVDTSVGNPILAGSFLVLTLPMTLLAALLLGDAALRRFAWVSLGFQLLGLAALGARAATGAVVLMALLLLWARLGRRGRVLLLAGAATAIAVAALPAARGFSGDLTLQERTVAWSLAPAAMDAGVVSPDRLLPLRPLVGLGPDMSAYAYQRVQPAWTAENRVAGYDWGRLFDRPHNWAVQLWLEAGAVGLGLWALAFLAVLRLARRSGMVGAMAAVALIGHLADQSFGILSPEGGAMRSLVLALPFAPHVSVTEAAREIPGLRLAPGVAVALAVVALSLLAADFLAMSGVRLGRAGDPAGGSRRLELAAGLTPSAEPILLRYASLYALYAMDLRRGVDLARRSVLGRPYDAQGWEYAAAMMRALKEDAKAERLEARWAQLWPGRAASVAVGLGTGG